MSKAQKRKGTREGSIWKAEHGDPFFVLPWPLAPRLPQIFPKRAWVRGWQHQLTSPFELFVLVYKPPSVRIDPRKRLRETSLAALATIFRLWRRDTLHPWFSARFWREKKWIKKLQEMPGKVACVRKIGCAGWFFFLLLWRILFRIEWTYRRVGVFIPSNLVHMATGLFPKKWDGARRGSQFFREKSLGSGYIPGCKLRS